MPSSESCSLISAINPLTIGPMLASAYGEINFEIVVATLEGFSKRAFSGDIFFGVKNRQPIREVSEVHHTEILPPNDFIFIVRQHHSVIKHWLDLPDTVLMVRFNNGLITKVQTKDRTASVDQLL